MVFGIQPKFATFSVLRTTPCVLHQEEDGKEYSDKPLNYFIGYAVPTSPGRSRFFTRRVRRCKVCLAMRAPDTPERCVSNGPGGVSVRIPREDPNCVMPLGEGSKTGSVRSTFLLIDRPRRLSYSAVCPLEESHRLARSSLSNTGIIPFVNSSVTVHPYEAPGVKFDST